MNKYELKPQHKPHIVIHSPQDINISLSARHRVNYILSIPITHQIYQFQMYQFQFRFSNSFLPSVGNNQFQFRNWN